MPIIIYFSSAAAAAHRSKRVIKLGSCLPPSSSGDGSVGPRKGVCIQQKHVRELPCAAMKTKLWTPARALNMNHTRDSCPAAVLVYVMVLILVNKDCVYSTA